MMKNLIVIAALSSSLVGCISGKTKESIATYAGTSQAFVDLMKNGNTTRAQEQEMLVQQANAFHGLNYAENDVPLPAHLRSLGEE